MNRLPALKSQLKEVFEETSGIEIAEADERASFMELGFDSLFLTQVALSLQKRFPVKITFRQLIDDLPNLETLAQHLDAALPSEVLSPAQPSASAALTSALPAAAAASAPLTGVPLSLPTAPVALDGSVQGLISAQLQLMQQQLALLGGRPLAPTLLGAGVEPVSALPAQAGSPIIQATAPAKPTAAAAAPKAEEDPKKKAFGAIARISLNKEELTPQQRSRLEALTRRYTARTKQSKEHTQENRAFNADPRVVTGFRPAIKELVYPIVVSRSKGSRIWDLDGNEYIDTLNGFGCNLFGWQPDFVVEAVKQQLDTGHEIGPQSPLAAECARLICEMTGFDRAAFCNTGSEAVLGCMRVARTVTGRSKIALFTGSYHGIFDEVIVRATKTRAIPAAPGITRETADNVVVLDYGTPEALEYIRTHAQELAAVLVEPIQSRRPDFRPREFLHELRKITEQAGTLLIFDEVICGFRMGARGAQEFYGIKADIASYGKVIGGGLPVGVIAGKRQFMDALDGGHWQFGDTSLPTVGVTYFAGTFVRHPLALAAVRSVLLHLKKEGPALQQRVNALADRLTAELNAFFQESGAPLEIRGFSSLWKTFFTQEQAWGDLLFVMLRDRGIHILDGFPCFFTSAHNDADVDALVKAFKESVAEMQESGFFPASEKTKAAAGAPAFNAEKPPVPGARLGRDPQGNPAWYVPNPQEPGKYMKLG